MPTLHPLSLRDPRLFQILALSSILIIGVALRAFEVSPVQYAAVLATALAVQWLGSFLNAMKFEAKSAIISSLSLTLLLRADTLWPLIAGAAIAIGSKFMFRFENKHIFNPTNIAIVIMIIATDAAWTTPGQWGTAVWFAALIAGAGSFITYRAARLDVPLIFLGVYAGLVFARALWLGDPLAIPVLRLQNGALILFAFFMISDPKTTPDGARARAFFAGATAAIAYVLQYHFFVTDGLFYALAGVSIVRPLIERFDRARAYQWGDAPEELKPVFRFAKAQRFPAPAE